MSRDRLAELVLKELLGDGNRFCCAVSSCPFFYSLSSVKVFLEDGSPGRTVHHFLDLGVR